MSIRERLGQIAAPVARDAIGLAGIGLVITGVSLVSVAAALIIAGLFCIAMAVLWARSS